MKKLTLILAAMVLTASQAFGQCGKRHEPAKP